VRSCYREANKLYLNLNGEVDVSKIITILSGKNIGVEEVRKGEVTLEEIYAKAVKWEEQ